MGDYEAILIAEGLKTNTTLSELDLYEIRFRFSSIVFIYRTQAMKLDQKELKPFPTC